MSTSYHCNALNVTITIYVPTAMSKTEEKKKHTRKQTLLLLPLCVYFQNSDYVFYEVKHSKIIITRTTTATENTLIFLPSVILYFVRTISISGDILIVVLSKRNEKKLLKSNRFGVKKLTLYSNSFIIRQKWICFVKRNRWNVDEKFRIPQK